MVRIVQIFALLDYVDSSRAYQIAFNHYQLWREILSLMHTYQILGLAQSTNYKSALNYTNRIYIYYLFFLVTVIFTRPHNGWSLDEFTCLVYQFTISADKFPALILYTASQNHCIIHFSSYRSEMQFWMDGHNWQLPFSLVEILLLLFWLAE